MNAKVHPLVAALVILLTVVAIGVWMWGSGQAKQFSGPSDLLQDPDGRLFVQMQTYLLEHDANGRFVERHDLAKLGVERVLGEIGSFPNGDLLLRRGPDSRSLLDDIRAYLRLPNDKPTKTDASAAGLHRCNLKTTSCEPFGSPLTDFRATFGVFISAASSDVYISDTTRHALLKYSAKGELLAEAKSGFKFPNGILLDDGRLYVADTNHHSVKVLDPGSESFGREIFSIDVVPDVAHNNKQTWPSDVARIGNEWWVNNMRSNMADGGVYIFDDNWRFKRKVDLPGGADPIDILAFGDVVLISDWKNDRVHRVSTDGQLLGDLRSPGLDVLVADSVSARWRYQSYGYMGIVGLGLLIFSLLVAALVIKSPETSGEKPARSDATVEFTDELVWLTPDTGVVRKIRLSIVLAAIFLVGLIPLLAYVVVATDFRLARVEFILPISALTLVFLPILWVSRSNLNSAIGIQGKIITLRDHTGREASCPIGRVRYTQVAIAGPDMAVFLGQQNMGIYDREALETQVFPKLADAQSVSAWEMQKILFRMRHPQGLINVLLAIGVALGAAWLMIEKTIL